MCLICPSWLLLPVAQTRKTNNHTRQWPRGLSTTILSIPTLIVEFTLLEVAHEYTLFCTDAHGRTARRNTYRADWESRVSATPSQCSIDSWSLSATARSVAGDPQLAICCSRTVSTGRKPSARAASPRDYSDPRARRRSRLRRSFSTARNEKLVLSLDDDRI